MATGIVNVWTAPAEQVAESYHRIENAYPGRFLLGVGIGHPEHTEEYRKPYDVLVEYLDALDAAKVPTSRRVVAALGPKVLKLVGAAQRRRPPVPDHTRAHRAGARIARQHGVFGARAQGGAEHLETPSRPARSVARRSASIWT